MIVTHIYPNVDEQPLPESIRPIEMLGTEVHIAAIPNGTSGGSPVVAFVAQHPDGTWCAIQLKLETAFHALRGLAGRHGIDTRSLDDLLGDICAKYIGEDSLCLKSAGHEGPCAP